MCLKKSDLDCGTTETNGNRGSENIAGREERNMK
jgi:hypothetical protein